MTRDERSEVIRKHLAAEGYHPELDGDGDVRFKVEGLTMFVAAAKKDERYYTVCLPNFWSLDTPQEVARAPKACHDVTKLVRGVKVMTVRDDTWCCLEAFYESVDDLVASLPRCLRAIRGAAHEYAKAMRA